MVSAGSTSEPTNAVTDPLFPLQWPHIAMETQAAWEAGCTGAGVRVAVIDGGIVAAHPDLSGAVDVACSRSFVREHPFDHDEGTFWHGTHVAGAMAPRGNDTGVIGVAPAATIIGVKASHDGRRRSKKRVGHNVPSDTVTDRSDSQVSWRISGRHPAWPSVDNKRLNAG